MIKISVEATVLHLMVDDKVTLALKLSDGTYVDFPIYDESFPLVKAGKKFRLTLEEVEMEADGPIDTLPKFGKVGDMLRGPRNSSARIQEVDEAKKPYPINNDWLAATSKMGKTPNIIDELRRDVAALETIKKALNQLEVRNDARLASYPDPEIEAHRKHIQEVIMPEAKKVEGMITGTAGEVDEAANKENEAAIPMVTPCDLCFHVKDGYAKEGVCFECKDFHMLDITPQHVQSSAEIQEKYIKWDRYDKTPYELMPMSDEEVSKFTKTRSEYPEELAQECQGSFDEVSNGLPMGVLRFAANEIKNITKAWAEMRNADGKVVDRNELYKCHVCVHNLESAEVGPCAVCHDGPMLESVSKGPFCQGCKHIGEYIELSMHCAVCFEGSRYDDSHKAVLPLDNDTVVNPD